MADRNKHLTAILLAGGQGSRMGKGVNKVYLSLGDSFILNYSLDLFEKCSLITDIIVITAAGEEKFCSQLCRQLGCKKIAAILAGGETRTESVMVGLQALQSDTELVLVHDGARPFLEMNLLTELIQYGTRQHAVIPVVPIKNTVKRISDEGLVLETLNREELYEVQTPQVFAKDILLDSYNKALVQHVLGTDDSQLVEMAGYEVHVIDGSYENIKITTPEDLILGESILKGWSCHE